MTVPVYNMTDTWNDGGTVFSAIKMNVTNTASAAGSMLLDLLIGGVSQFNVDRTGQVNILSTGTILVGALTQIATNFISMGGSLGFFDRGGGGYHWGASDDVVLVRDAAGILAQRNGTNGQVFRLYNTYTDPSNYERCGINWASNILTIGTEAAGTGTQRTLHLDGAGISLKSSGVVCLSVSSTVVRTEIDFYFADNDTYLDTDGVEGVLKISNFTNGGNGTGWFHWGGNKRVTADVPFTSTTTLGTVTGLSVNVRAGRTYSFWAKLAFTDAAAGGIRAAIAGTATATNILYDGYIIDSAANGMKGNAQATALGTVVANAATTGTAGVVHIEGTITVNAAGTLLVQAAQSVSNGTATTIKRGSYFIVHDMP